MAGVQDEPAPIVVIDTTEFHKSLLLDSAGWPALLAHSRRGNITLLIPQVVLLEAERHFSRQIDKHIRDASSLAKDLSHSGITVPFDMREVSDAAADSLDGYLRTIESKLLACDATRHSWKNTGKRRWSRLQPCWSVSSSPTRFSTAENPSTYARPASWVRSCVSTSATPADSHDPATPI